jgi:hypothetical protein
MLTRTRWVVRVLSVLYACQIVIDAAHRSFNPVGILLLVGLVFLLYEQAWAWWATVVGFVSQMIIVATLTFPTMGYPTVRAFGHELHDIGRIAVGVVILFISAGILLCLALDHPWAWHARRDGAKKDLVQD